MQPCLCSNVQMCNVRKLYGLTRSTKAAAREQRHVVVEKEKSRKPETLL